MRSVSVDRQDEPARFLVPGHNRRPDSVTPLGKRQCHRARLRTADSLDSAQDDGAAISHEKVRLAGHNGVADLALCRGVGSQLTRLDRLGEPFR